MGLTNNQSTSTTFLQIINGKFAKKVTADTENAVERINKKGDKVYEVYYDSLSGILNNIEFRDGDFGKEIHYTFIDGIDKFKLQAPFTSVVNKGFMTRLPNCNFDKVVSFHLGYDKEKDRHFAYIRQNDATVKSAYTKDEPNGLPSMEKIKVKGKEQWDDGKQLEFLEKMIATKIIPKLGGDVFSSKPAEKAKNEEPTDLPFD